MANIEKYQLQPVQRHVSDFCNTDTSQSNPLLTLLTAIVRWWRIVLATFLAVCIIGLPLLWIVVKPYYKATAAIRITPVISSILFNGDNSIPMYKSFVHTQADLIVSDMVLQKVAEDLTMANVISAATSATSDTAPEDKLKGADTARMVKTLRAMVNSGTLRVKHEDNTELIKITMKSPEPEQAAAIVNSFLKAYMNMVAAEECKSEDDKIAVLENEAAALSQKLRRQRTAIGEMTREYGTASLTARQEMKLKRLSDLQNKITEFEMGRITLKVKEKLLENKRELEIEPQELIRLRYDFINADLMVKTLTINTVQLDQELIFAKQQLTETNPALARKVEVVKTLKERLQQRREEMGKNFDDMVARELTRKDKNKLSAVKMQLQQTEFYRQRLQEMLSAEDASTIELGRKQLAIEDLQTQFDMTKEFYDTVRRRVRELEMERKRPARVSKAYYANTAPFEDKRKKYTIALMFAAMGLAALPAILKNRFDKSLRTLNDVAQATGIRIIGTTTRSSDVEQSLLPEYFVNDYQTICANLGLLNEHGIPKKLSITSPCPRDGKTTFAINLSMSLARMDKKVLLIDGDLRKADIAYLMKLSGVSNGLKHVLLGAEPQDFICSTSIEGLDILPSNPCQPSTVYNLIASQRSRDILDSISTQYDHIIIDTPPLLDVPDALLWAKAVDAVILVAYSGHTKSTDIRETLDRLAQTGTTVLGTVLNNVSVRQSYNSYRCYAEPTSTTTPHWHNATRVNLLPMGEPENDVHKEYATNCDA